MTKHRLQLHHHLLHYNILFLLLATGFFAFNGTSGYSDKQFQVGLLMAIAYFCWGIFHHLSDGDLNWKIVIEYLGISLFGVGALWVLLYSL